MRATSAVALCVVLSGCVSGPRIVEPTVPMTVGHNITVSSQLSWASTGGSGQTQLWTKNGTGLEELYFFTGIRTGDAILLSKGTSLFSPASLNARYDSKMSQEDVIAFLSGKLANRGYQGVRTGNLRSAPFGDTQGFRFDMTFSTPGGLEMKSMVLAAQRDETLDVILFLAPAEYYFDRYAPEVERIFASVRTK